MFVCFFVFIVPVALVLVSLFPIIYQLNKMKAVIYTFRFILFGIVNKQKILIVFRRGTKRKVCTSFIGEIIGAKNQLQF